MSTEKQQAKQLSVWSKLYRGETDFNFVEKRRRTYLFSAILVAVCVVIMIVRGFELGIDFAGGNQYTVPVDSDASITEVEGVAEEVGAEVASAQVTGSGDDLSYVIRTAALDADVSREARDAMAETAGVEPDAISVAEVSATWGASVSQQALLALIVFLVLIGAFIWVRFERRMAAAALSGLAFDAVLVCGVFSLIGFEVTPSTMVGMLTVLSYSLYDTVVVFDKVRENTANLLQSRDRTYAEGVNSAVNETLMRSINTTVIGALPVGALLFIGVGFLGVGTLKDLALVLFVGVVVGTYSSIFLVSPWLVDMAERTSLYRTHNRKVANKRAGGADADETSSADRRGGEPEAAEGDELELELVEERTPATAGSSPARSRSGSRSTRPPQRRKKRR